MRHGIVCEQILLLCHGCLHSTNNATYKYRYAIYLFHAALPLAALFYCRLQRRVKLVQEAHVVLEVEAQVLHAILQHGNTLNTHTEGEARILL